jgi:50S ribosomal subunit-associated GTPase HflX
MSSTGRSTLEEVLYAHVLVHVRDCTLPKHIFDEQGECVVSLRVMSVGGWCASE